MEKEASFKGFGGQETFTRVPDTFFQQLLGQIESLAELKVTLYFIWRMSIMENKSRSLTLAEISADETFMIGLDEKSLVHGLTLAVERGSLLMVKAGDENFYFLNSPRGRAAVEDLKKDDLNHYSRPFNQPPRPRPNIYTLYESSIGPMTPLLADALRDAEQTYTPEQIEYAFAQAVKNKKRHWKYVEAILRNRKEAEDAEKQTGRDTEEDRRQYYEGKYADFIKH